MVCYTSMITEPATPEADLAPDGRMVRPPKKRSSSGKKELGERHELKFR